MTRLLQLLADDEPAAPQSTEMMLDICLHDGGMVCRTRAPRLNHERPRVQWHDRRSRKERDADSRPVKEIIQSNRA